MSIQKIHADSGDCANSELDLFLVPPTVSQLERGCYVNYLPVASLEGNAPLEFIVKGTDDYIDLSRCHLRLVLKIVKSDGTAPSEVIAPCNHFFHALFSQVDVFLNDHLVSASHTLYPYRAYLETLLNYGTDATRSQLGTSLWYLDTPGKMELTSRENEGWHQRKGYVKPTGIELISWIHADLFNQDRYLLNQVDLRLRLLRSKPEFFLMTGEADPSYKVQIHEAEFFVRKVKPTSGVILAHARLLGSESAKYPLRRTDLRMFSIASGLTSVNRDNLFLGQLPVRLVLGMLESTSLNGSYEKNPFNFQHFDLNYISLHIDSDQQSYTPDFANGRYLRCYQGLLEAVDAWKSDSGINLSRKAYGEGFTLFGFQLTPEQRECNQVFSLIKSGSVRVELKFAKPLPASVTVILYAEYQNLLEIPLDRKVLFDYSS